MPAQDHGNGSISVSWQLGDGSHLHLLANLGGKPVPLPQQRPAGMPIWGVQSDHELEPWSVFWQIERK